ncbi:MAG: hypothetical protein D3M94_06130 [Rhodocyclales bacterium GT-UBC]|nr:MAG: hypothetical protein D3M94_06130 [Rhodocyclales bacterium GT-UBC]
MNAKSLELAMRHGALKVRIEQQRQVLAQQVLPLESALARGDALLQGVDWLKHHPAAVGVALAAVVASGPKRAWRWARRGFFFWRGWQAVRRSITKSGLL